MCANTGEKGMFLFHYQKKNKNLLTSLLFEISHHVTEVSRLMKTQVDKKRSLH